jgi:hypothetical protein
VTRVLEAQNRDRHSTQGQKMFFRRMSDLAEEQNQENSTSYHRQHQGFLSGASSSAGPGAFQSTYGEHNALLDHEGRSHQQPTTAVVEKGPETGCAVTVEDESEVECEQEEEVEMHALYNLLMTDGLTRKLSKLKLEEQLEQFLKRNMFSSETSCYKMIEELQLLLRKQYPKCMIHPYGPDYIGIRFMVDAVLIFVDLFGKTYLSGF